MYVFVTLIPSSSTESVIHYGDLIWYTCQTRLGWGNVEELSWDSGSSLKKHLNVELQLALAAIQKCLTLLHDDLGPDTKWLWLSNQSINVFVNLPQCPKDPLVRWSICHWCHSTPRSRNNDPRGSAGGTTGYQINPYKKKSKTLTHV